VSAARHINNVEGLEEYWKFTDLTSAKQYLESLTRATAFGGKQNYDYWKIIFETGKSPQGLQIMPQGLNLDELLTE
jgi:hypothetical protein